MSNHKQDPARIDAYTDFVKSLELFTIALTSSKFRVNRYEFFKQRDADLVVGVSCKANKIRRDHFDLQAELLLQLRRKRARPILELSATYHLHFHAAPPLDPKLARRFADSDARLVLWPYFREYVNNVSARMYVPPLLLPISK